jgi:hypothetical protein
MHIQGETKQTVLACCNVTRAMQSRGAKKGISLEPNKSQYTTSLTGRQRSRTTTEEFAKAKEDNDMMNIKDVLSPGEEVLFGTQQHRLVPGGRETSPGQIFVTTERVIIETSKWLGLKKEYQDLHYSDIMNVVLKKNIWSSDIIINSRFQGQIVMKSIGKGDSQKVERIVNEGIRSYRFGYGGPHYDYDERVTTSEPPRREEGRLMRWRK